MGLDFWGNDLIGQIRKVGGSIAKYYFLKDHLGSIRMTINSSGTVVGYDDYYPFGVIMPGRSQVSSSDNKYKFTSKERDTETGYDYFGTRYYDSRIGRWLSVDPLADKYLGLSPYNYTLNNPLRFVDPNGMYSAATEDGSEEEEDEWVKEEKKRQKQQENTFNYLKQLAETGTQFSQEVSLGIQKLGKEIYSLIYEEGPTALNNASDEIFVGGFVSGTVVTLAGFPEVGAPLMGFTTGVSSVADATSTLITGIDALVNGGDSRIYNFNYQSIRFFTNLGTGGMTKRIANGTSSINWKLFENFDKILPYNPLGYGF